MNTNDIKYFAQQARLLLLEGVSQRLIYWGFDANGNNTETLEATHGGYLFRGEVYTDASVPAKWNALRKKITSKQAVNDVVEQAAYTWFNRLMAIKILEENQYIDTTLQYAEGVRTPMLVQNAKQGNHSIKGEANRKLLIDLLKDNREEEAFSLLVTNMCNEHKLLNDVFGHIDDYTELLIPQNLLQKDGLMDLINNGYIKQEDYQEVELIGWLYQFYISDKKDEVFAGFKKNKKARAEDIPAATQIFTPKWIVKYMVENTVGKIYLDFETDSDLRSKMKYLVEQGVDDREKGLESNDSSSLTPHPLPLINDITELTLLDPACGSGHILVTGFELLFEMYLEVGYNARNAVESILKHNLIGLDIDDRAMQLARFAVLLKGAELLKGNGSGSIASRELMNNPVLIPHVYSFSEEQQFESEELQTFLGGEGQKYSAELKDALTLLNQGKNIGSALKIELSDDTVMFIEQQYTNWQQKQETSALNIQETDIWNRLQPMLDVILVLAKKYSAVVANPPYMGQRNMNEELKKYVNRHYPLTKSDLFAVFIEAMTNMLQENARVGCITMESWMFLSSYEKLRHHIIDNYSIVSLAHFGWHILGIAFGTAAMILENSNNLIKGEYSYLTIDDVDRIKNEPYVFPKKDNGRYAVIPQTNFSKIPGSPIAYWVSTDIIKVFEQHSLSKISDPRLGMATANNKLFTRMFWEVNKDTFTANINDRKHALESNFKWFPYAKGGDYRKWYGNINLLVNWKNDGEAIKNFTDSKGKVRSHNYNLEYIFKKGITWNALSSKDTSFRILENGLFDNAGSSLFLYDEIQYYYILGLLNTKIVQLLLPIVNPTLNYQPGTIGNIPIAISAMSDFKDDFVINNLHIAKKDWDSLETSWDFKQPPLLNGSSSLKDAYKRWEKDVTNDFFQLHSNEEELNRIFIEIYGLQDELTPEVALKDITILQDELDRKALEELEPLFREQGKEAITLPISKEEVISQFISYAIGVFMGRYRLDKPGLNIAHPNPSDEEIASSEYNGHTIEIDDDGIVPLMGDDCNFPDDALKRSTELVHAIWGEESLTENINFIHNALGVNLHRWLTERFWRYHTSGKMYKKKPIYWLFSSNVSRPQNAAFKVLVYMHRMDRYTLYNIQRKYLYPHQEYISQEVERMEKNEADLNRTELRELEKLRKWEVELRDYSEKLKKLANQEIEFDLDDGVTENYKLFEGVVAKI